VTSSRFALLLLAAVALHYEVQDRVAVALVLLFGALQGTG
jgi:hypothetical protein